MAEALAAHQQRGDYSSITDAETFAVVLTTHPREVSHDRHLFVGYNPEENPANHDGPTPTELARYRSDMQRTNCTFEKVEILPRNIGYVKFNEFPDPAICRPTVAAAMKKLNHADAIIFDLRDNHGGDPKMVSLIASYLFKRPTHVNDIYDRRENTTQQFWTKSPVSGNALADKRAYVLTSSTTFSGAEEFAYDLKMLKRATLVGETTTGGAHPARTHQIDDHFRIRVPGARPINPISKKDWEGTGVEPDVKVNAADALEAAQKLAEQHQNRN
jgi:C-terminal processing protease CtpA/Prc